MAIAPFDYTSGNGFGQGLQLAGLQQQVQLQRAAAEQAQQQQQAQQQFQSDWQAAYSSGDPAQFDALVAKYPGQIDTLKSAIGFKDDQHRAALGNTARDLRVAIQSGNPQAIAAAAQKNAATLASVGSSPEDVLTQFQNDPQSLMHTIDAVGMGALGPKDYYDFQDKSANRQVTMRGQDLSAETARRGQDITMRGQNISAQNSALDRQIRMAELQDKGLDRQIARETNLARLTELQQKQADAQQKASDARQLKTQTAQQTYDTFNTALGTIAELKAAPGLGKAVGLSSMFPTVPGSDAANFEATLDTFKAQTFLPMVQSMKGMGALSDAEGKKLTDAVGALSTKMSETEFNRSLNRIEGQLRSKLASAQKIYGVPMQTATPQTPATQAPATQGGGYSNLWGD